jgi:hypothetical protein
MVVEYLNKVELQNLLRNSKLPVSGNREKLIQLCLDNELITIYEHLATRNIIDTRRRWLIHHLGLLGCELRSDSMLCQNYIQNGIGDLKEIANTMTVMNFFHKYTDYNSIRNEIYNNASENYARNIEQWKNNDRYYERPFFGEYFDSIDASETAKTIALDRWLERYPSLELSLEEKTFPISLQRSVIGRIAETLFNKWLKSVFTDYEFINNIEDDDTRDIIRDFLYHNPNLTLETLETLKNNSDNVFHESFYERLNKIHNMDSAKKEINEYASKEMSNAKVYIRCLHGQNYLLDTIFNSLYPSKNVIIATKNAIMKCILSQQQKPTDQLQTTIKNVFGNKIANINKKNITGCWSCALCFYNGEVNGLIQHNRSKHGIERYQDISATRKHNITLQKFIEIVRDEYAKHMRQSFAALCIQRQWRHCISCPEYLACKNRLLREFSESSFIQFEKMN